MNVGNFRDASLGVLVIVCALFTDFAVTDILFAEKISRASNTEIVKK